LYPSPDERGAQASLRERQRAEVLRTLGLDGAGQVSAEAFSEAVHRFLGRTMSVVALTQLDDMLHEHDPVNVPTTSTEHPNWRRRYSVTIESLTDDHPAWRLVEILGADRLASGRESRGPKITAKQTVG
jgi:4-alpha-glucanotransferase